MSFRLTSLRILILSLAFTVSLWTVVTWPLAVHMTEAIPVSATGPENAEPVEMVPGDHLQLLYQLWLGHDTFFGPTPWSTNLYEFNTGDDAARRAYSTYYFPFNFFFSPGYWFSGHAAGLNLAGLLSVFISIWATWLWLRRWLPGRPVVVVCATVLGQLLPYRWHTLLHGSPTGLSLMWVPVLLLGMDIWLRDGRARGAALAGAAVFFAGWSDIHVFFFASLLAAGWVVPNFLAARGSWRPGRPACLEVVKSSWPLWIWVALVGTQVAQLLQGMKGTNVEGGRSTGEVALFSPHWGELLAPEGFGGRAEIYLGPILPLLLAAGFAGLAWRAWRSPESRPHALLFGTLAVGTLAITLMATGPNHPLGGIWWARTVRVLPPLGKLRQPAKIFLLLPPLISLMFALALSPLSRRAGRIFAPFVLLVTGWTLVSAITPQLCALQDRNEAYEAVAADADPARAVVIPLWPGDSHWSSIYVHHAMTSRLRIVNGYKPSRNLKYMEEMYEPLGGINLGLLTDAQLDLLASRDITHVMLQENAFPEKVSPFSVGRTLSRLLIHPRLELMARDGPSWAFRILKEPRDPSPAPPWRYWGTKVVRNAEFGEEPLERVEGEGLAKGAAALLTPNSPMLRLDVAWTDTTEPLRLFLRVGGPGRLHIVTRCGDFSSTHILDVHQPELHYTSLLLPTGDAVDTLWVEARAESGAVRVDLVQAGPAEWSPRPAGPVEMYPTALFHAGHTDLDTNRVVFLPGRDPAAPILYGPRLPLASGRYRLELDVDSPAKDGTPLGIFRQREAGNDAPGVEVIAGEKTAFTFDHPGQRMFEIEFVYNGREKVSVGTLRLTPVEEGGQ